MAVLCWVGGSLTTLATVCLWHLLTRRAWRTRVQDLLRNMLSEIVDEIVDLVRERLRDEK